MQELDSTLDQLRHQRATLPELAEIAELQAKRTDVENLARDARIVVDDLGLEQQKVDTDVEAVKARRARDRDRMDKGLITNPKDLERLQHELESLERRISTLEDEELEVMEKLEEAQGELTKLEGMVAETDERLAALATSRDEKLGDLEERLQEVQGRRGPAAEGLPEDLLALYARMREQKGAWRIVDIVVDDVSTVENYRSSFNRIIKKEGMDGLIARLNGTGKVVDSGGSKGSSR